MKTKSFAETIFNKNNCLFSNRSDFGRTGAADRTSTRPNPLIKKTITYGPSNLVEMFRERHFWSQTRSQGNPHGSEAVLKNHHCGAASVGECNMKICFY